MGKYRWRDSITGLFVKRNKALANPSTTERERRKPQGKPRGRHILFDELPGLNSVAMSTASAAVLDLIKRSAEGTAALRSTDEATASRVTAKGVLVTVTVKVEATDGEDGSHVG